VFFYNPTNCDITNCEASQLQCAETKYGSRWLQQGFSKPFSHRTSDKVLLFHIKEHQEIRA